MADSISIKESDSRQEASQMRQSVMVSFWCAPLSTITRFRFQFFLNGQVLSAYEVTSRKRASKRLREAIKL